jgi:hypothetical protein
MGWTQWRKIADSEYWYDDAFDWDGPACYELSIAGTRGGNRKIVYVGETINEKKRMSAYAQHGSHLSEIIHEHLKDGWHLFYRSRSAESKQDAVEMQNSLLAKFNYDWNIVLNT